MYAKDQGLAVATARSILEGSKPLLEAAGYDKMVVSTYCLLRFTFFSFLVKSMKIFMTLSWR